MPFKFIDGRYAAQILQNIPTLRKKKLEKVKNLYFQRSQSTFKTRIFDSYLGPLLSRGDLLLFFNRDWPRRWPIEPQWLANDEGYLGYSPIRVGRLKNYLMQALSVVAAFSFMIFWGEQEQNVTGRQTVSLLQKYHYRQQSAILHLFLFFHLKPLEGRKKVNTHFIFG